ncbi:MAG: tRNA lysidine(34) synthetase TilS [Alphaproteobacteria bacterium]
MTPDTTNPVSDSEFALMMDALESVRHPTHLALAVSGGPDSMALLLLTARWADGHGVALTALTVDHGLRPESAAEASQVAKWCAARGVAHKVLVWEGQKPAANVQALARQARYGLMEAWCSTHQVPVLLLAHHLEDQAETLLLRLGRGSGVYGLSGMATETASRFPGAPVRVRPLLALPRARLKATLGAARQDWIDDPSNRNLASARVRTRQLWQHLETIGITPARVARTAANLGRARDAIDQAAADLIARAGRLESAGYAVIRPGVLTDAHDEVALRALSRLLAAVGGQHYGPRLERLERLLSRIADGSLGNGLTLCGCRVLPAEDRKELLIVREARSMEGPLPLGEGMQVWDGRFLIEGAWPGAGHIDRLGRSGLAAVRAACSKEDYQRIPATARPVLPALYDSAGLLAVPAFDFHRQGAEVPAIRVKWLGYHALSASQPIA